MPSQGKLSTYAPCRCNQLQWKTQNQTTIISVIIIVVIINYNNNNNNASHIVAFAVVDNLYLIDS